VIQPVWRRLAPVLILSVWISAPARAETGQPAVLDTLLATYEKVETLNADFVQESRFAGFSTARRFAGVVNIQRPDRMRWDYRDGSDQQIYVNGREVTVYAPGMQQAIVSILSPASDGQIPIHLLSDVTGLTRTYSVEETAPHTLRLTPRELSPQTPERIDLELEPDSGLIHRVTMHLPGGNRSDITFSGQTVNGGVAAERFSFSAPKGTHVVRPEALPGGTR